MLKDSCRSVQYSCAGIISNIVRYLNWIRFELTKRNCRLSSPTSSCMVETVIGLTEPEKFSSASSSMDIVSFASRNRRLVNCRASLCLISTSTLFVSILFRSLETDVLTGSFDNSISGEYGLLI